MKKLLSILLTIALLASALAGCGDTGSNETSPSPSSDNQASDQVASDDQNTSDNQPSEETPTEVTHVIAATSGRPKPFIFVNEDGTVTGYEAEVLYAVDELLEEYEFEIQTADFAAILTGIDAGIYDLGFNSISRTEEREEKYLYGDEYVGYSYTGAIVRIDDDSIHTLEDLGGKKAPSKVSGSPTQLFLESYNEEHPDNPVELIYTTAEDLKVIQDLEAGVYDFTFLESTVFDSYIEEYPELANTLKFVGFSEEETEQFSGNAYTWYLFQKTDEGAALQEAVDSALRQLKEDGTLNELAQEFLHYDVVR